MNEDKKWYRDCRNFKLKQPDGEYRELQNKSKFINIGSQEAEIALGLSANLPLVCFEGGVCSGSSNTISIIGGGAQTDLLCLCSKVVFFEGVPTTLLLFEEAAVVSFGNSLKILN